MTRVQIGEIISTHGLDGELKIWPYNEDENFYEQLNYVYLGGEDSSKKIIKIRPFKNTYLLKLEGIDSIEIAKKYIKSVLSIDMTDMPKPNDGKYYFYQLLDMEVQSSDGVVFGKLEEIIQGAVKDIFVVRNQEGKEWLIPSVKEFIKDIDIKNHRLTVEIIEGMSNEN